MIARLKKALAAWCRRTAMRLDPPTQPYGEWDSAQGCLAIKLADQNGGARTLAHVNISPGTMRVPRGGA